MTRFAEGVPQAHDAASLRVGSFTNTGAQPSPLVQILLSPASCRPEGERNGMDSTVDHGLLGVLGPAA